VLVPLYVCPLLVLAPLCTCPQYQCISAAPAAAARPACARGGRRNQRGASAQQTPGTFTPAHVSIRSTRQHTQHTSAYVSIRQHTSAYVSTHTPAYVSIRQHTSHTSEYVRVQRSPQESYRVSGSAARDSARTIFSHDRRHRAQLALIDRLALTSGKTPENTSDRSQTEMHRAQRITRLHTHMNASMNAVHYLLLCLSALTTVASKMIPEQARWLESPVRVCNFLCTSSCV
jgi:hypothetical protein